MNLNAKSDTTLEEDIRKHCHINTNDKYDYFVGIKGDSDNVIVYFPIGYQLPDTDSQIRLDINHLIHILLEFNPKNDGFLGIHQSATSRKVNFPINAYRNVIEYYLSSGGKYYVEIEKTYKTSMLGKQNWPRTIKNQTPLVQQKNGISSFVYTNFTVSAKITNDLKHITQINRFCVYEAFKKLGWLYVPYMPELPGLHLDIKTSIAILNERLHHTNDDKKKVLFQSMKDMLEFMDKEKSSQHFSFGTYEFHRVWEKLIDRAFGERNKQKYFPNTKWLLNGGEYSSQYSLQPDTIMIYNNKYYVLDAKYYRYGVTGNPKHLPETSSINKQITYGEYLECTHGIKNENLFNAFIMPYNSTTNTLNLTDSMGCIGEAVGDWRQNKKNYERIQGIVIDIRYLMYHYNRDLSKEKEKLAKCIEGALEKRKMEQAIKDSIHSVYKFNYIDNSSVIADTLEIYKEIDAK